MANFYKNTGYCLIIILILTVFVSCTSNKNDDEDTVSKLRIGILPDESREKLIERYSLVFPTKSGHG
jgi:ABC-type phosphate/phosphonate transport system substrate-binding protein